ncbi:transposase [Micromonospora citrea]|uniref:transposase n=1 Tax=Micromonospora citrea TaxID=47855 RepID=UPI003C3E4FC8
MHLRPNRYPDELRQRAVRLNRESDPKPVIRRLAEQLGVHHEAFRNWIRRAEADAGEHHDRPTSQMAVGVQQDAAPTRTYENERSQVVRGAAECRRSSLGGPATRSAAAGDGRRLLCDPTARIIR